jgi:serine/threonine-protein kinase
MAPEQIKGAKDLDKRLDVYAMGIVLYELTTGVVPFDGETEYDIMTKHMSENVPSVKGLRPDAPDWIDQVIAKATQKDRNNRYQSCEEFRAAIDQFDGGIVVPRSMTAYENSIVDTGSGTTGPRAGGGTMQMTPPPAVNSSPSFPTPEKKSGGAGLIIGIAAVVLIGGGVGAYFAFAGDSGKKDDKSAQNDDKSDKKAGKSDKTEDKGTTKTDKTDKKPGKKDSLDALLGTWKTESSNRELKAEKEGDEIVFRVVKPADWDGAFNQDEVRFKLKKGLDDSTYYVIDRYRPSPGTGHTFSKGAYASCITENENVKEKPLEGVLKTPEVLEVTLATVQVGLVPDPGDAKVVASCKPPVVTGTVKSTLKKMD